MRKAAFLLGLICSGLAAQDAAFEGTAVNSVTGEPLSGVHFRLYSTTRYSVEQAWASISDKRGHFSINPIPAGRYWMTAYQAGFVWIGPNGSTANDSVLLQGGQKTSDFKLTMAPEAVIRGHVVDEAGDPVQGVRMTLQPASPESFLVSYGQEDIFTDEHGHFRLAGPPGKFYIRAQGYDYDWAQNSAGELVAYYPGARDVSQAKVVEAVAGRETAEIEIRLGAWPPPTISAKTDGGPSRTFSGVVRNAVTDQPIQRARVKLRGMNPGIIETRADDLGRFSIAGFSRYWNLVSASRPGFLGNQTGGTSVGTGGDGYAEVRLTPAGAVAGRVIDDEGKPVEHALVVVVGAHSTERFADRVSTDGEGWFRICGLAPGKYRVRASFRDSPAVQDYLMPPEIRTDGTKETHYSPTFYGGTLTEAGSAQVNVPPGGEANGIEIKLIRTPVVSISGRVYGFPAEAGRLYVQVRLPGEHLNSTNVGVKSDGTFHVWKVDPGQYTLVAVGSEGKRQSAPAEIEIAGKDIEHVELQYFEPVTIAGTVQYLDEGAKWGWYIGPPGQGQPLFSDGGPLTSPPPTRLELEGGESYSGHPLAIASTKGPFTFERLPAGRYWIHPGDSTTYVKWLRWGTETINGNEFEIRPGIGTQSLVVALSSATASVAGVVRDANGPVAGAQVFLIPEDEYITGRRRATRTRVDGSYEFQNVIPGKYRVAAADPDDFAAMQGLTREDYDAVAARLELQAGDKVTRDLRRRER